ncbi:MAG: hypothetical protein M1306_02565 [Candidatus Thermoplasmatota archaeon]|nr:hypothetical protein [Candidatus Thermoplasmatota archaeon]
MNEISKLLKGLGINMDMIEIKKGGKYKVISASGGDDPMVTEGEYVGYTVLGEEGAVVFRVKNNTKSLLRMIPVSGLYAIEFENEDLLKQKEKTDETGKMDYIK